MSRLGIQKGVLPKPRGENVRRQFADRKPPGPYGNNARTSSWLPPTAGRRTGSREGAVTRAASSPDSLQQSRVWSSTNTFSCLTRLYTQAQLRAHTNSHAFQPWQPVWDCTKHPYVAADFMEINPKLTA